jgi:hypothetical protein
MEQATGKSTLYRIRVKEVLDDQWSEWIDGTVLSYEDDVTVLTCRITDQALGTACTLSSSKSAATTYSTIAVASIVNMAG